jgi:hypothetical protein
MTIRRDRTRYSLVDCPSLEGAFNAYAIRKCLQTTVLTLAQACLPVIKDPTKAPTKAPTKPSDLCTACYRALVGALVTLTHASPTNS